jgi:hypothetical protein
MIRIRYVLLAGAVLVGAAGCSTLRMKPPADVARQSDVYEAKNRSHATGLFVDESFALGPYKVAKVDRDWDKGGSFTVLGYSSADVTTGFSWELREGAETLAGRCGSLTATTGFAVLGGKLSSSDTKVACGCGAGETAATLELEGRHRGKAKGKVTLPSGTFEIASVHETNAAWGQMEPAGFRVDGEGGPVAAVEVLRPGRLWLAKSLEAAERRQLACLLTGAMLYVEPDEPGTD